MWVQRRRFRRLRAIDIGLYEPIFRILDGIKQKPPLRIWLDTGTEETGWERARQLRDRLVEMGWRLDDDLQYTEVKGADHSERAWAARIETVLRYLYPPHR